MSFGKKKKEEIQPKILMGPSEAAGRSKLLELINRPYQKYTGQRFAEFPQQERLAGLLQERIDQPRQPIYEQSLGSLGQIIRGETDPATSPLFTNLRTQLLREEEDALKRFDRAQQIKGVFDSSGSEFGRGRIITDTSSKIGEILGQLYEAERGRVLPAVSQAANIANLIESEPIRRAQAILGISPVLKGIEEEPLAFDYEKFLAEQLFSYQYQVPIAERLITNPEAFYFPQYREKKTGVGQLAGTILGGAAGYSIPGVGPIVGAGIGSRIGDLIYA